MQGIALLTPPVRPDDLMTIKEVSELTKVSTRTVIRWTENDLPSVLLGGCRRIRRADLVDYIDRRTNNDDCDDGYSIGLKEAD